jgi:transcriptional regulator with XRE-family HTH domain
MAKKNNLDDKISDLKSRRPALANIDWGQILREEPEVFNGLANGVSRVDRNRKSKLDHQTGTRRLHNFIQDDFSEKEFKEAFKIICEKDTIRKTAEKVNISPAHVYNLKEGKAQPTLELMEVIAKAYGRKPEYFVEYRIINVLASVDKFLSKNPETATVWFNKIKQSEGISIK